jgi:hypothetical protein
MAEWKKTFSRLRFIILPSNLPTEEAQVAVP